MVSWIELLDVGITTYLKVAYLVTSTVIRTNHLCEIATINDTPVVL